MKFVELNRYFFPIAKDQDPNFEYLRFWDRKAPGWLDWSELLELRRVVLLAEASSGKSAEFWNQSTQLAVQGYKAFYLRIEELADHGFESALDSGDVKVFKKWRDSTEEGWFFLDSVDEARLNRKSFETALKRFNRDLDQSVERARILISCRVSDWKGDEDKDAIQHYLPAWERAEDTSSENGEHGALLDPIFKPKNRSSTNWSPKPYLKPNELLIVQIVPLTIHQCRALAAACGVIDIEQFMLSVSQYGLDVFTERPGDVIELAEYWKTHGRFDSIAVMVEYGVSQKLKETHSYRPDNDTLTPQKARAGAERVAAALTFGKTFTAKAPGYDPNQSLAEGSLDPASILYDWTEAERNALLRRGVFAPSTYGRVRFHHRTTQEYLTGQWLHRLLNSNCPREEIWNLIFVDRYDVETVVPSLRPAAAWLVLREADCLEEIIRREPLVLLQHGDPRALSLDHKKKLLVSFAKKHVSGEIADNSVDRKALWMFADIGLSDTIHEAWDLNKRADFQSYLLRLIREGKITKCAGLARSVALDEAANEYHRIVAVEALKSCTNEEGLAAVAGLFVKSRNTASPRLAASFAKALFPDHLTIRELLKVIADSHPAREHTVGGFPNALIELYDLCHDQASRAELVGGIAAICLAEPFEERYNRVSARHSELAKHLEPIAKKELHALGDSQIPEYLVRLLMVVERANREYRSQQDWPDLCKMVQGNTQLQRQLFWADVAEQREKVSNNQEIIRFWTLRFSISPLWDFQRKDLKWLWDDLINLTIEADRRIALRGIAVVLRNVNELEPHINELRAITKMSPNLTKDLDTYLSPPVDAANSKWMEEHEAHNQRAAEQEERNKKSWVKFKQELQTNPNQLRDPSCISDWATGMFRLSILTDWLYHRTNSHDDRAAREWRLLEEGFGREIAEAYRDGLKVLWRHVEPERPKQRKGGGYTVKNSTILCYAAVGIEAAENPEWTHGLSNDDAVQAALHGTVSEQGYPMWIEALIRSHPQVVLPVIQQVIKREWSSISGIRSDFLSQFASRSFRIPGRVQDLLYQQILSAEPRHLDNLDRALRIVANMTLHGDQIAKLKATAKRRFKKHTAAGSEDRALRYLALFLALGINGAVDDLITWLRRANSHTNQDQAQKTLAYLFDRDNAVLSNALEAASVPTLEKLIRVAHFYVRPEEDIRHEGVYSPGLRDKAESARGLLLRALLNRSGEEAFRTIQKLANESEFAVLADRFHELARAKAERDAEPPAWCEIETVALEREYTTPVKTGSDLHRLIQSVLKDIQFQLINGDASSRSLLESAKDEEEVQNWIAEQMNFRARGRFAAHREVEVAGGDKPDIIVSSTSAQCEIAVEVKHGGKNWSPRQLEKALCKQLAQNYLKPSIRRHGILVVTHHGKRKWRDPNCRQNINFDVLIKWLDAIAKAIHENKSGLIEVRCMGIDASPPTAK